MTERLVILLHGVGARGELVADLGRAWAEVLPDTAFVAPDAPFVFDGGDFGRQWFSLSGITAENRTGRIIAAREAFDALIGGIVQAHGFEGRLERVALAGFSQGAIMTLDAVASGRWPVGAAVAFAGRLGTPDPLTLASTPVFMAHGTADGAVPFSEGVAAETRLKAAGVDVRLHVSPDFGHGYTPKAVKLAGRFLADRLGAPRPGVMERLKGLFDGR